MTDARVPMRSAEGQAAINAGHRRRTDRIDAEVLSAIRAHHGRPIDHIAGRAGYSITGVRAALRRLAAAGVITVEAKRGRGTTITLNNRAADPAADGGGA